MDSHVFVDAVAFVAIKQKESSLHEKALDCSQRLEDENASLVTCNNFVSEAATVLSQRVSHKAAVDFVTELKEIGFPVLFIDPETDELAKKIFESQTSKNVSYSDCQGMALMKKRKIKKIFTFDKHFKKNGFDTVS